MSGDVQPRKRKDKKRKKDDLSIEEPRGTAAVFGEGDVFIHSQHEHGTGGHWCAKIIFFSLLAILVGLIGLIILENRGLTELEANSIESRYSGVLEGWLEDAPEDDHHDEHTLDLNHADEHDENEAVSDEQHNLNEDEDELDEGETYEDNSEENANEANSQENTNEDNTEENANEDMSEENAKEDNSEENANENNSEQGDDADNGDEETENEYEEPSNEDADDEEIQYGALANKGNYELYESHEDDENGVLDNENEDDDEIEYDNGNESEEKNLSVENEKHHEEVTRKEDEAESLNNYKDNDNQEHSLEAQNYEEEDDDHEEENKDMEVERIERESEDLELISTELPTLNEEADNDSQENYVNEIYSYENRVEGQESDQDEDDFSEQENTPEDNDNEPITVEPISSPSGKPYQEVEESSEQLPIDTLAEEEEYERRQEELRREQEKASHLWLKLSVGAALLLATHAVVRRAAAAAAPAPGHGTDGSDEEEVHEGTPVLDRRMTLLLEKPSHPVETKTLSYEEKAKTLTREPEHVPVVTQAMTQLLTHEIEDDESVEEEEPEMIDNKTLSSVSKFHTFDKKLERKEKEDLEDEEDNNIAEPSSKLIKHENEKQQDTDEVPDDVEIIDEELEDEEEAEEEEISDVDDAELLSRLEAKYGRLPEPERTAQRNKDGGNSVEDWWPGEPSDPRWRRQLDHAEDQLNQEYEY